MVAPQSNAISREFHRHRTRFTVVAMVAASLYAFDAWTIPPPPSVELELEWAGLPNDVAVLRSCLAEGLPASARIRDMSAYRAALRALANESDSAAIPILRRLFEERWPEQMERDLRLAAVVDWSGRTTSTSVIEAIECERMAYLAQCVYALAYMKDAESHRLGIELLERVEALYRGERDSFALDTYGWAFTWSALALWCRPKPQTAWPQDLRSRLSRSLRRRGCRLSPCHQLRRRLLR